MPKSSDPPATCDSPFDVVLRARERRTLRRELCRWYAAEKRDLPWRGTRDPYAIWISETMLQQTRVETVLDYYTRFLARFPALDDLARAGEQEVLTAWSGLGYYRRARALRSAAQLVVEQHAGVFPTSRGACLDLPGVGPYTAGAVLSMAFQQSEPLVDGNVARVFARLFAIPSEIESGTTQRVLWRLASALVPPAPCPTPSVLPDECPGNWNQALMELGALVCTSRAPDCAACPLGDLCLARRRGLVDVLPRRAARRARVDVLLEILVTIGEDGVLLLRRPEGGRMAGLWELPTREVPNESGVVHALWPPEFDGVRLAGGEELGSVRHAITHHRIRARVLRGARTGRSIATRSSAASAMPHLRWVQPDELSEIGVTGLTRKCLRRFGPPAFKVSSGAPRFPAPRSPSAREAPP